MAETIARLEHEGSTMDVPFLCKLEDSWVKEIREQEGELEEDDTVVRFMDDHLAEDAKWEFSLASPKQMVELFFGEKYFGFAPLPHKINDSGAPSTDKEVMAHLSDNKGCPVARMKTEINLSRKLLASYVRPLKEEAQNANGKVHGSFLLHGTRTGRLSSRSPALQTIPNKGSGAVKRSFVSQFGEEGCLLQADYSQIELRMAAAKSGDKRMINVYRKGLDIHLETTKRIFADKIKGNPDEFLKRLEETDPYEAKAWRTIAKRVNFGVIYGIGAAGIQNLLRAEGINITDAEAKSYLSAFYKAYPGVERCIDEVQANLRIEGEVRTDYGRYRRLPEVFSDDEEVVQRAFRQGFNAIIQSDASDTTLTALVLIREALVERGMMSKVIITVHDSIVLDVHKSELEEVYDLVKETMEGIAYLVQDVWNGFVNTSILTTVPIVADVEVGYNWRDLQKVNDRDFEAALLASEKEREEHDAKI